MQPNSPLRCTKIMKTLKEHMFKLLILIPLFFVSSTSFSYQSCIVHPDAQEAASKELLKLVTADQAIRQNFNLKKTDLQEMQTGDLRRRIRVSELFAAGCLKTADDYYSAALVFQHGETSDHYYQTYIWSKRSAELGNIKAKHLSALAIDRYLVNVNKKQIFGSQFYSFKGNPCFCMVPVDKSFTESFRKNIAGGTLKERYHLLASINPKHCPVVDCQMPLKQMSKADRAQFGL